MSYKMERDKTGSTPYVLIDEGKKYLRLEGESFHEDVIVFFKDVSDWLKKFLKTDFDSFTFDCELNYFNSSTAKLLFNMLLDMDASDNASNIIVNWIAKKNNEIIIECGEDFQEEISNMEFNIILK